MNKMTIFQQKIPCIINYIIVILFEYYNKNGI